MFGHIRSPAACRRTLHPTSADLEQNHAKYVQALCDLFERNKALASNKIGLVDECCLCVRGCGCGCGSNVGVDVGGCLRVFCLHVCVCVRGWLFVCLLV